MKRFIVSAAVAALALAFAGSALASYTPKIVVSQAGTKTTIHVTIAKEDDATLKLTIYAPTAAAATLGQTPGTQIGTVSAQLTQSDAAGTQQGQCSTGDVSWSVASG